MRRRALVLVGAAATLLLASCAAQVNPDATAGEEFGFWYGLWHGLILPVTFVVSLFNDTVGIYEVDNNGNWYNFGFLIGAGGIGLPGFLTGRRRSR
ncbi:MAG: hypothetical protein ACOYXW_07315 [Actinomycetota bacterium]